MALYVVPKKKKRFYGVHYLTTTSCVRWRWSVGTQSGIKRFFLYRKKTHFFEREKKENCHVSK
jgi:hypothetical protein